MEQENLPVPQEQEPQETPRKLRGLYRHVKISVKTLDKIIVVLVVVLIVCLVFGVLHSGYTVSFDPGGGTDVAAQELRYGDKVTEPEDPTREGYVFDGWYADESLETPWDFENNLVNDSMELYAKWVPVETE